jgi:hypothetical protein
MDGEFSIKLSTCLHNLSFGGLLIFLKSSCTEKSSFLSIENNGISLLDLKKLIESVKLNSSISLTNSHTTLLFI